MIFKKKTTITATAAITAQEIKAQLPPLITRLQETAGAEFKMAALFGSLACGVFHSGRSDINLLLVTNRLDAGALKKIHELFRSSPLRPWLSPVFLKAGELPHFAEVFPIKMLEIKSCYQLLAGEDLLANLQIDRQCLRWRAEQELRNMLSRLRRAIAQNYHHPHFVLNHFSRYLGYYLSILKSLHYLRDPAPADNPAEAALSWLQIDKTLMERLTAVKRKPPQEVSAAEIDEACASFLEVLEQSLTRIDAIGEK